MIAIDLSGQVVVVTGATGTIGAGIVERFAAAGATIVRAVRRAGTAAPAGAVVTDVVADLTACGAEHVVDAALGAHGRIDALVNCAGDQRGAALATVSSQQWAETIELNLTAAHRLTQCFAAHVAARGGGGAVVHVTSIEAERPAVDHGHYGVTKAALRQHARAAAIELGALGVRVNSVAPGLIERQGIAEQWPDGVARWQAAVPLGRLGTATDVADACVFLCSPLAAWITGAELVVDGGVSALPGW